MQVRILPGVFMLTKTEKTRERLLDKVCDDLSDCSLSAPILVGSRDICPEHCGEDSDWDYLILVKSLKKCRGTLHIETELDDDEEYREAYGYARNDDDDDDRDKSPFMALRLGILNLIITDKVAFFENFILANSVAKKLHLVKKEDRITLFKAILYGEG